MAPWFDVTNSYQRRWIRAHRGRNPEYSPECPPELLPAPADADSLAGRDVVWKAMGDPAVGIDAPIGA